MYSSRRCLLSSVAGNGKSGAGGGALRSGQPQGASLEPCGCAVVSGDVNA